MHQPPYKSPVSGEYLLPWVLLHSMRDYLDMPILARRHEAVKPVFNFSPGLLSQVAEYADVTAWDSFLAAAMKPPAETTGSERLFLLDNFLALNHETMVKPYPRFAELADKATSYAKRNSVIGRFSDQEFCDLQVWYFLSWAGDTLREDSRVAELLVKGRDFTQDDKESFRSAVLELLGRIKPLLQELVATGGAEVSCSPMYHPILPLLISSQSAREALPDVRLPAGLFAGPEDARHQIVMGLDYVSSQLGMPVRGMWPSEGAVSEPALELMERAGVRWIATDEKMLPSGEGPLGAKGRRLYKPWRRGKTAVFFRDARLSDLIGFTYARWEPEVAVRHFIGELAREAQGCGLARPVITIAMDGENAWEYYLHGGMKFIDELYRKLAADDRFEVVSPSDVLDEGEELPELPRITAGSWIDGTFSTWIGDPVKNRAWEQLTSARNAVQSGLVKNHLPQQERDKILDLMMRAEASDWFWWYGKGHSSQYDPEFDLLFRHHLIAIYRRLGMHPPSELDRPLEPPRLKTSATEYPTHLISPRITGKQDSYYKWLSSGRVTVTQGFLHRPELLIRELRFGFDLDRMYLKAEAVEPIRNLLERRNAQIALRFIRPRQVTLAVQVEANGALRVEEAGVDGLCERVEIGLDSVLEMAIPLDWLFAGRGRQSTAEPLVEMYLVLTRKERQIERFPQADTVVFRLRGEELDAENWHI